MRRLGNGWRAGVYAILATAFTIWIVGGSTSFHQCVRDHKNDDRYKALHEGSPIVRAEAVRLRFVADCTGIFIDQNGNSITALATILIAAFTGTLWWVTKRSVRAAEAAAIAAARSAKVAESSLTELERAYVFVVIRPAIQAVVMGVSGSCRLFDAFVGITIHNHGKRPAILRRLRGYGIVAETAPTELIELPETSRRLPDGLAVAAGDPFSTQVSVRLTDDEWHDIRNWNRWLYFCGLVDYQDVLGNDRTTGYCWRLLWRSTGASEFNIADSPLNYRT